MTGREKPIQTIVQSSSKDAKQANAKRTGSAGRSSRSSEKRGSGGFQRQFIIIFAVCGFFSLATLFRLQRYMLQPYASLSDIGVFDETDDDDGVFAVKQEYDAAMLKKETATSNNSEKSAGDDDDEDTEVDKKAEPDNNNDQSTKDDIDADNDDDEKDDESTPQQEENPEEKNDQKEQKEAEPTGETSQNAAEADNTNDQSANGDNDADDDDDGKDNKSDPQKEVKEEQEKVHPTRKSGQKDRRRMNVVVLFPDDWRHNSIGAENPLVKTPFLDSLANEGIRFRQNAVTTSICWQSRATLFTGQWASRHRSYKLKCPHFARGEAWNQTWPALLQDDGYFVGHVGKWQYHNDNTDRFDWSKFFEGRHWYREKGKDISGEDLARDAAIRFLNERPKDKPFAMTVAFYPPKPVGSSREPGAQWKPKNESRALYDNVTIPEPYNATEAFSLLPDFLQRGTSAARGRWWGRYRDSEHYQEAMKNIYALITQVDQACKEIVDELKKQGLYNNTMVIFTTDNGMFHGSHGLAGKWYPYQESIRVPLIVYDPRMPAAKIGTISDSLTLNVDLAETILGAAGLKPHERMQGRDMSDLYLPNGKGALSKDPWREDFFYEFTFLNNENFIPSSNALVTKNWKYIDWHAHNYAQLFDLENDPLELKDVKDDPANKERFVEMKTRMEKIRDELKEDWIGCERGGYGRNDPDFYQLQAIQAAEEATKNKTVER